MTPIILLVTSLYLMAMSVCICLVGKFKGETGERYHSIVLSNTTCSGLQPRKWIEKLLIVCQNEGRTSGSAFNESDGSPPISAEYNAIVRQYIQTMADAGEHGLDSDLDLIRYGISRTFRKSSETRARRAAEFQRSRWRQSTDGKRWRGLKEGDLSLPWWIIMLTLES